MELECGELTEKIIGAAIRVHRALGPGLLESVYETCLCHELAREGLGAQRQVELPVVYDTIRLDCGFRIDVLVEEQVVLELKAVEKIQPVHEAQPITYLRLSGKPVGLLINFNVIRLRDGILRRALTRPIPSEA
jgi:GxxExxY protein